MRPTEVPAIEVESIADSLQPPAFTGSLLGERTHGFVFACEAQRRRYALLPPLLQEIIAVALHTVLVHCPSNQPGGTRPSGLSMWSTGSPQIFRRAKASNRSGWQIREISIFNPALRCDTHFVTLQPCANLQSPVPPPAR